VAFISQIYLECISSYEKISIAILAGVLRDDIECTGIGVIHTSSRLKWEMSLDTGYQPLLYDVQCTYSLHRSILGGMFLRSLH